MCTFLADRLLTWTIEIEEWVLWRKKGGKFRVERGTWQVASTAFIPDSFPRLPYWLPCTYMHGINI